MNELKRKAIRGGIAKVVGQGMSFVLRLAFTMILARLLSPTDFGLIGMVTAVTGLYALFTTAGLADAAVQTSEITDNQMSTLFWCNILFGAFLSLICMATAPILVTFYSEPQLFWVTVAMATGFLITAGGAQHNALLQRQLRYFSLTLIENFSELFGIAVGVSLAFAGYGYWALVATGIASQSAATIFLWLTTAWIPGRPQRAAGLRPLLRFGSTITLNGLIVYLAYNFEKVLLGRFWGANALGIYGRAYQLVNIPVQNVNSAIGSVAFSALSRLQNDGARLKRYFLTGYALLLTVTMPITIFCLLFANDIVIVVLGSQWIEAASILRLLSPTILVFGVINPLSWLLLTLGLQVRSLQIAMVIAPLVMGAYVVGLPYGPSGVAFAYSAAMSLWLIPHIIWCLRDTLISPWELLSAMRQPLLAGSAAALCVVTLQPIWGQLPSAILRLGLGGGCMFLVYLVILLYVFGQKTFYRDILSEIWGKRPRRPIGAL
jgi:O-antigen/teichoic acid export membrane protein